MHVCLHFPGGGDSKQGMLLIADRCAEFNHDAIAHVLIDMCVVLQQDRFHITEILIEFGDYDFCRMLLSITGESLQVGEQHADASILGADTVFDHQLNHGRIHGRVKRLFDFFFVGPY